MLLRSSHFCFVFFFATHSTGRDWRHARD